MTESAAIDASSARASDASLMRSFQSIRGSLSVALDEDDVGEDGDERDEERPDEARRVPHCDLPSVRELGERGVALEAALRRRRDREALRRGDLVAGRGKTYDARASDLPERV